MMSTTATTARFNYWHAIADATVLVDTAKASTEYPAKETSGHDSLRRAALILTVTAWESYVEDTIQEQFAPRLEKATGPLDVESAFNACAHDWLSQGKGPRTPKELLLWAGDGWKTKLAQHLGRDIDGLNTPSASNVRKLSKRYLGLDVTRSWRWSGTSSDRACARLDALIRHRGDLVHRGTKIFARKGSATLRQVREAIRLIDKLVERTDVTLGVPPRTVRDAF